MKTEYACRRGNCRVMCMRPSLETSRGFLKCTATCLLPPSMTCGMRSTAPQCCILAICRRRRHGCFIMASNTQPIRQRLLFDLISTGTSTLTLSSVLRGVLWARRACLSTLLPQHCFCPRGCVTYRIAAPSNWCLHFCAWAASQVPLTHVHGAEPPILPTQLLGCPSRGERDQFYLSLYLGTLEMTAQIDQG